MKRRTKKKSNRSSIVIIVVLLASAALLSSSMRTNEDESLSNSLNKSVGTTLSPYLFKDAMTTLFWVGESAGPDNAGIANDESFWDDSWQEHFGGYDDPLRRCGSRPCAFEPYENAFYVALPYADYKDGKLKTNAKDVPWFFSPTLENPLLKNRWVEVRNGESICYGQWEDVGPNEEDDFAYVFGTAAKPKNTFGEKAGLDVSPALFMCLGLRDNGVTVWRFIDEKNVPDGPWKIVVTKSRINWD
jgi:hypothetical protein